MIKDGGRKGGRLILHVGTHKTGTTSFQESLKVNADILRDKGVGAVGETLVGRDGEARFRYNLAGLSDLFIRPEIATGFRLRHGHDTPTPRFEAAVRRSRWAIDLRRRPERDLLLSAEGFCFLRTAAEARRLRRFLAATRRRPVILLATRNAADWRASWTAQLMKNKSVRAGLAKADPAHRIDADWYFDVDAIRSFWSGLGELREIDFDATMAVEGNIVPRLYREAGIDLDGLDVDVRLNTRAERS